MVLRFCNSLAAFSLSVENVSASFSCLSASLKLCRVSHGVFYPRALANELVLEIALVPASGVVKGSDPTKLSYELTNIELEYEVIESKQLAYEVESYYMNRKRFMFEHVTHYKTISFPKGTKPIINESINVPRRSMKGLLLLFHEDYVAGTRDSEKTFNPDIKDVKVPINGVPNKIYNKRMKPRYMFEEVFTRFGKVNSSMNVTKFFGDKFALFVDLRSKKYNSLHGSGKILVNTEDGAPLEINRRATGSGKVNCHIFILSDAQFNPVNKELESITYWKTARSVDSSEKS